MTAKEIKHVEPEEYKIDNRDNMETELHFDHGDTHFIVRVNPWDLVEDLIGCTAGALPLRAVVSWREQVVQIATEIERSLEISP